MSILEKHNYLNKGIRYLKNVKIREYDMVDGGFSIIKKYSLLNNKEIDNLSNLSKMDRHKRVGMLIRNNYELSKNLLNGFKESRLLFAEKNKIKELKILSIKKDALFIIEDSADILELEGNINFKLKNIYSSFLLLDRTEIYYSNRKNFMDIKGISEENIELHRDFMYNFIKKIIKSNELDGSKNNLFSLLKSFRELYLCGQLDLDYYREFNASSKFRLNKLLYDSTLYVDKISDEFIPYLNTEYNYVMILRHLINNLL